AVTSRGLALLLVLAGGTVGTALRALVEQGIGNDRAWPWATFVGNVSGAAVLGLLIQLLAVHDHATPRSGVLRLALGSGLLGGYIPYSSIVLGAVRVAERDLVTAVAYDAATIGLGVLAALAAMTVVRTWHHARDHRGRQPGARGRPGRRAT